VSSSTERATTQETVDRLLAYAGLPLSAERRARLTPPLERLVAAANELSRRMAAAEHRAVVPLTGVHGR
jgi:hypothetical protein